MNLVLGVTVGASAVRLARPGTPDHSGPVFRTRPVERGRSVPEEVAADATREAIAENSGQGSSHTVVVYRDQTQAGALQTAFEQRGIESFELVPEVAATIRLLDEPGPLTDQNTLVVVDLGSSGTTISVVDRPSRTTVVTARSLRVSGDHFDELVYSDQTVRRRIANPADTDSNTELRARCRLAKEQLSTRSAVCLPGGGGLLLLSREVFDALVVPSVEALATEVREVIATSGRNPDVVVLIGGGARIPIVRSVLAAWVECPVVAPDQPDLVTAQGAALIAEFSATPYSRPPVVTPPIVAPIFAPYPIHTPAEAPGPVRELTRSGVATIGTIQPGALHLNYVADVSAEPVLAPPPEPESPYAAEEPQPRTNRHVRHVDPNAEPHVSEFDSLDTDDDDVDTDTVMVDAQAYSAMREDVGAQTLHAPWLAGPEQAEVEQAEAQNPLRFAGLGAGVIAAIVIVGLGVGYSDKVFGDSGEAVPASTESTTTAPPSTTTVRPTTTLPPPPPPTVEPPPVVQSPPVIEETYEAPPPPPPPPPPPALNIPGLPPILLPVLPQFPGL